ncbi:MAG TPA: ATP-binding protein [Steroidobacteraceae bacterium]
MNSLRNKLLGGLLGAVVLVGALGAWVTYRNALAEANAFFDAHLRETALLLRDQMYGFTSAPLPREVPDYDFVVQVWTLDGVRVYLSRPHTVLPGLTTLGLSTSATPNGRWRVFGIEAGTRVIQVAQPMNVREQRAAHLAARTVMPFALLIPALALLIVWLVRRSVAPVQHFADSLRLRAPDAPGPLPDAGLPDEVRPLVAGMNDLLSRLQDSVERERAFIADAAHELRTPLTALDLQVQALRDSVTGTDREEALQRLKAGVARATRLVEQLLALAREERVGAQARTPVALAGLVREVLEELLPLADARGVDLGVTRTDDVEVAGDRDSLRVLVRNLLDNAVRYAPVDGRVDVSVERPAGASARARVIVTDNGPGIAPEERERVFDRFYRVPGTATGGSGIGLALARSIARHHGGDVHLADAPAGPGLQVTVDLPALPPA